ncbi:MAG: hypothetical protein EOP64_04930 [Sphingomonas sp.]|nr:MAG: hypothetical protein EOP64_04930 [Sphingomonas sp.]
MIRKPDAREFEERSTVAAMRDARTLAVEGGRGIGQGTATLLKWWLIVMLGFGFVMSVLSHFGAMGMLIAMAGSVAWFILARQKRANRAPGLAMPRRPTAPGAIGQMNAVTNGQYDLSVAVVGRQAAKLAVPAILMFPTSGMFSFMAPLTLFGITLFALAILIVARLSGDRTVLRFDARSLTVRGLLGDGTMLWDDVSDIAVRKASIFNLPILFASGTRRNIEVTAGINRLGGPARMLIPYPLLGIDQGGLVELFDTLLMVQAGTSDLNSTTGQVGAKSGSPAPDQVTMPFDPDGIITRYMAGRENLAEVARPDLTPTSGKPIFGRKITQR